MEHKIIQSLVRSILTNPLNYEWTLQGFGMLRTYLPGEDNLRLHIWNSLYRVPQVSDLHTHPWDFESYVVAGEVKNYRFVESRENLESALRGNWRYDPYLKQSIQCGEGGCIKGEPELVGLQCSSIDYVLEGCTYTQHAAEIHLSAPEDGAVTIVKRTVPEGGNPDMAYVYWRKDEDWVSAEPRPATPEEVNAITEHSLYRWFQG